jgi:hypothetical protein
MKKLKIILSVLISLCVGILIGGYFFPSYNPGRFGNKSLPELFNHEDLLGLLASVGIQKFPGRMPFKVFETDKTVVIKHPFSSGRIHYVITPKKDIKNIGEISEANAQYLTDAFLVARGIIEREKLSKYRF